MKEITFIDTTIRDGQQSLWAESMRTGMMLSVASEMDEVGFEAIEVISTSHFKKCVLELREDPWERIRLLSKYIKKTPLIGVNQGNFDPFNNNPSAISKLYFERLAANGIKRVQLMSPSNDMKFLIPSRVRFAHEAGIEVSLALTYSFSPKHTDVYYAQKAREALELNVQRFHLKDPGGLLTPERIETLVPAIIENIDGIPLDVHSHCTTGLAPITYLRAINLGANTLHTSIPPLANGSSHPSILNVTRNARALDFNFDIDESVVQSISKRLTSIAQREGLPIGAPLEYDYYQYIHQVPGGVISNLKHQLAKLNMGDRLGEVLEEAVQVRKDLGYPIMVTPFSQFVVTQAAINVMLNERYKEIPDEIIRFVQGFWGEEASASVDPNLRDKILSMPRASQFKFEETYEPSLEEVRQKLGGSGVSDDELLLRYIMSEKEISTMRAAGPFKQYSVETPIVALIQEMTKRQDYNHIYIQKGEFSFSLNKKPVL